MREPFGVCVGLTEACERSIVSKMRLIAFDIWITSPLIRQSFLLSSRTVFMFSIQMASIGPSNTTHFLSGVLEDANSRNVLATMPSDHWESTTSSFIKLNWQGAEDRGQGADDRGSRVILLTEGTFHRRNILALHKFCIGCCSHNRIKSKRKRHNLRIFLSSDHE